MSEMIIPTLAARKAARKKSQLLDSDAPVAPETIAPALPASFVEPTTTTAPQVTGAHTPAQTTTSAATPATEAASTAVTATQVNAAPTSPITASTSAAPSALAVNPAPTLASTPGPVAKEISVQSILPTAQDIAKSVEKSKTAPALSPTLSKEMLAKLALEMGFELAKPKREFTKHTYSITPWHKDTMKQYTDVLGIAMQDAVCEAFDLFFAKHQAEFDAVRKAKGKV